MCIIVPNSVKIGRIVTRYGDFPIFKMAAVRHLGFFIKILTVVGLKRFKLRHYYEISWRSVEPLLRYYLSLSWKFTAKSVGEKNVGNRSAFDKVRGKNVAAPFSNTV